MKFKQRLREVKQVTTEVSILVPVQETRKVTFAAVRNRSETTLQHMVELGSPGSDHKLDLRSLWCRTGSGKDSRLRGVSMHPDRKEPHFLSPGQADNTSVYPHDWGQNMAPKIVLWHKDYLSTWH